MRILGLNGWPDRSHDAAACLVVDGSLVALAEEERFSRHRYSYDEVPVGAATYCLESAGLSLDDIDVVALGWDYEAVYRIRGRNWNATDANVIATLLPHNLFPRHSTPKLRMVPHHLCHAASCFFTSDFESAAILVADGQGECASTTLAIGAGNEINVIKEYPISQSIGYFYEAISQAIGFGLLDGGKTMGLAAYGTIRDWERFLEISSDDFRFRVPDFNIPRRGHQIDEQQLVLEQWQPIIDVFAEANQQSNHSFDMRSGTFVPTHNGVPGHLLDLAATSQYIVEKVMQNLASQATQAAGSRNLCIAGGVGLNCVANGKLLTHSSIDRIYMQPACGDAGVSLGAALMVAAECGELRRQQMRHAFWGPAFSDHQIEQTLRETDLRWEVPESVEDAVADLLAQRQIIAWFQGAMEVGPRALGARSILADPRERSIASRVNFTKGREPWRPLAPSVLSEMAGEYLDNADYGPFMLTSTSVREVAKNLLPGVVHRDGSTRPQLVSTGIHDAFRRMIQAFQEITGVGLVLNTSFNLAREPIVCSPADAVRAFRLSELDALAIGKFLVRR